MTKEMTTLGDQFPVELQRVRELLEMYKALPPQSGWFGVANLTSLIHQAEQALVSGDVVAMVRLYPEMKEAQ